MYRGLCRFPGLIIVCSLAYYARFETKVLFRFCDGHDRFRNRNAATSCSSHASAVS